MTDLADQRPQQALDGLRTAQQTHRREPLIACFIGHAYLQLKLPADAERAFERALQADEDCAEAHFGLALSALQRHDWEAAADAALGIVALNHHHPRAHFLLGTALARMGRPRRAIQAFETALAQRPDDAAAHGWLAAIHDQVTQDAGRAAHHRSMAQTARRWAGALA
jgi:tetratricopeptide (TPR) repeat protein